MKTVYKNCVSCKSAIIYGDSCHRHKDRVGAYCTNASRNRKEAVRVGFDHVCPKWELHADFKDDELCRQLEEGK